ncbi:FecR family protein [Dyadobacter luticola]|uniref:DUF4974 domain-containing protein n=1 Tax=Dyadobacter luticola TaxID=1979387 RepID=A0A5R9L5V9_9BACT|nr:FecR domain-containing protein [Dyadobacter luticola]TLV03769.1 DUF4974 domain-containing protein [Dyadobacter luticola]
MKPEFNHHIDDLLVKSLLEEVTLAEQIEINQWLSDSDDHQRYFEDFETIWKQSKQLAIRSNVDENAAWDRFRKRVQTSREDFESGTRVVPLHPKKSFGIVRIAAMVALTALVGWLAYQFNFKHSGSEMVVIQSGTKTLVDTLPDGSVVTLNKKSTLSYPSQFNGDKREVTLTGEGFFEVTPNKEKPFIISVNDVTVRVVGTSFNVKDNSRETEVIVETGLVEVAKDHQKIKVKPMEKATVHHAAGDFSKEETSEEFHKYYRTGRLICDNTPLWRLVEILNESFGKEIVIENKQKRNLTINTTFEQDSLESILAVISETLAVTVEYKQGQIILK